MRPLRRSAGFTLIELLVALVLVGMISVMLFESLRFSQRSYKQIVRRGEQSWQMFSTQRLIRSLLENAYPSRPTAEDASAFLGEGNSITFTAPAPLADGGAGLYRYEISLRPDKNGSNELVIRWRNDFASGDGGMAQDSPAEEVLLGAVESVNWGYRARAADGSADDVWLEDWANQQELPGSIRLRVGFASDDARNWPDLVVATRINADAHCEFDTVAQRCRNAS